MYYEMFRLVKGRYILFDPNDIAVIGGNSWKTDEHNTLLIQITYANGENVLHEKVSVASITTSKITFIKGITEPFETIVVKASEVKNIHFKLLNNYFQSFACFKTEFTLVSHENVSLRINNKIRVGNPYFINVCGQEYPLYRYMSGACICYKKNNNKYSFICADGEGDTTTYVFSIETDEDGQYITCDDLSNTECVDTYDIAMRKVVSIKVKNFELVNDFIKDNESMN